MRYMFAEALANIRHGWLISLLSVVIITLTISIASAQLRSQVEKMRQTTSVVYVSMPEALARSEKAFGEFGSIVIEGLQESNPLPASLEIYVDEALLSRPMLEALAVQVKSLPGVEDVAYKQFNSDFMRKAETVTRGLSILMGGALHLYRPMT